MPHKIFDNKKHKLRDAIKLELKKAKSADFVVGWFFITGLREFQKEIDGLEKLRILAGARTNKATAEIMMLSEKYERAVQQALEKNKYLNPATIQKILNNEAEEICKHLSAIQPSQENIDFIKWLFKKLQQKKIEIRIYPKETLHAKLYLIHSLKKKNEGVAFVGSSNLSLSGVALNTELNIALEDKENYNFLSNWFEELWKESERADFTAMLALALEKSWAMNKEITPFRIYLRLLHEIFTTEDYSEIPDISQNYKEATLLNFQFDAVIDAYQRLQKYNGVFLADVPGLGKTYMGAALLAHLQEEGKRAIIIGPPKLKENWEEVLSLFGVGTARFFSYGKLEEILQDERLMKREVVLIDEAHHFRNPNSQRYRDMELICENKKVILVGATPQNLSIWDLYNQIKLFTPSDVFHQFRIEPVSLKEYFKLCEENKASIENLVDQIVIRRTRKDIKEIYKNKNLHFPKRIGPFRVDYSIDDVYPGGLYNKLNEAINKLYLARYDVGSYIKSSAFTPEEEQRIKVAGKNLKDIMRVILFRRLESSVAAFRDSIRWMRKSNEAFLKALAENKVLIGEDAEDIYEQIRSDIDLDDIEFTEIDENGSKFNILKLKQDIESDLNIMNEIESFISEEKIPPEEDDKLQALINLLKSPEIQSKKILIFTFFASTAKYLGENLKAIFPKVDYVTQQDGQVLTKAYKFAPKANKKNIPQDEEINILVSTEILSEGLNLQDGQVIINYELHWNPVRIIQRIGRIDRIGTEHNEIFVYNFFPEEQADKHINLNERINKRIKEIIRIYGGDEKTINMSEEEVSRKLFQIYTQDKRALEEEEIVSTSHKYRMEWLKLKQEYPEEYKTALSLPEMMNIGVNAKDKEYKNAAAVFCKANDFFKLKLINANGDTVQKNDWDIIPLFECDVNFKGKDIKDKNFFNAIHKALLDFEKEANLREQSRFIPEKIIEQVIKRLDFIKRGKPNNFKSKVENAKQKLINSQLKNSDRRKLRSVLKKYGKTPEEFLNEVEEIVKNINIIDASEPQYVYAKLILAEFYN
ncbi:MAG: helicase-related protein [Minisyncoccia bacterium]